jgi:hypothetical protein
MASFRNCALDLSCMLLVLAVVDDDVGACFDEAKGDPRPSPPLAPVTTTVSPLKSRRLETGGGLSVAFAAPPSPASADASPTLSTASWLG